MMSTGLFPIKITIVEKQKQKQETQDAKGIVALPFFFVSEEEQEIREENDRQRTMAVCMWDRRW